MNLAAVLSVSSSAWMTPSGRLTTPAAAVEVELMGMKMARSSSGLAGCAFRTTKIETPFLHESGGTVRTD